MRAKAIVAGFNNKQKIRWLLTEVGQVQTVGMYSTIQDVSERMCTGQSCEAVMTALRQLAASRAKSRSAGQQEPVGIVVRALDFDVQVNLI
jgi:hypothetical protein